MTSIENDTFNPALSEILQRCGLSTKNFPDVGITPEDKVRFNVCAQQLAWWLAMQREQHHGSKHGPTGIEQLVAPPYSVTSHAGSGSCLTRRLSWRRAFGGTDWPDTKHCQQ